MAGMLMRIILIMYQFGNDCKRPNPFILAGISRRLSQAMLGALLLAIGVRTAKSTFLYFDPSIAIGFLFKAYPFSVQGSIKRSGGKFTHGARDSSHVEVDGRLVTGMNWESAAGVADAMIRLLSRKQ